MQHQQRVLAVWKKYDCNPFKSILGLLVQVRGWAAGRAQLTRRRGECSRGPGGDAPTLPPSSTPAGARLHWLLLRAARLCHTQGEASARGGLPIRRELAAPALRCVSTTAVLRPTSCLTVPLPPSPPLAPTAAAEPGGGRDAVVHRSDGGRPHIPAARPGRPLVPGNSGAGRGRRHGGPGALASVGWGQRQGGLPHARLGPVLWHVPGDPRCLCFTHLPAWPRPSPAAPHPCTSTRPRRCARR